MLGFDQNDADYAVWLELDGKEYELNRFEISFGQEVDYKGQPQDEVRGGIIYATLNEIVPESIYEWTMKNRTKNGTVVFKISSGSSPLKIEFSNSYCLSLNRNIDSMGYGLKTRLVISPEELLINGISFDNHWINLKKI